MSFAENDDFRGSKIIKNWSLTRQKPVLIGSECLKR